MSGFNSDEYVNVADRITQFYEKYPDGRLTTVDWDVKPDLDGKNYLWVHAKAYRTQDDPLPGDGLAWYPVPGSGFLEGSELMKAQTAAIGRAIVMLGFQTKNLASLDEVENARTTVTQTAGNGHTPQTMVVPFGKHKGKQVHEVPTDYWEWCLANDKLNDELRAAVELHLGLAGAAVATPSDLDDIPF